MKPRPHSLTFQSIAIMLTRAMAAGVLAQGFVVAGSHLSPVDTFYPSGLNDTSYISNSALGTNGGIYSAPANRASQGSPFGVYDYCSMPHPRVNEYELPNDRHAKLVYLEYLQRHQRRTMYNLAPGGEVRVYTLLWSNRGDIGLLTHNCFVIEPTI